MLFKNTEYFLNTSYCLVEGREVRDQVGRSEGIKKHRSGPSWRGSVDSVPACKPKGHRFGSQSGHMPGLQARSPVQGE